MAGTKLWIVTCFALFTILLAPIAWKFTQVKRVHLSLESIQSLSWNQSKFSLPQQQTIQIYTLDTLISESIHLSISSEHIEYVVRPFKITDEQREVLRQTNSSQALDNVLADIAPTTAFSVFLLCNTTSISIVNDAILTIGTFRQAWSHSACVVDDDPSLVRAVQRLAQDYVFPNVLHTSNDSKRARIADKYRIQLSLLQEEPDQNSNSMDLLYDLEKQYLLPFLRKMNSVATFSIEKEVLYYARLAREVHYHRENKYYYILANDLKHFKSTNDFLLSSVLSDREPVLHLSLFLPSTLHSPLYLQGKQHTASAFEIPSWGMVVIDNGNNTVTDRKQAVESMAGLWITQLRTLLGIPSTLSMNKGTLDFLPSVTDGVAQWEVDQLVRELLWYHVKRTVETLHSIAALVDAIPELQTQERVQDHINRAIESIIYIEKLQANTTEDVLLIYARQGAEEADAAYYDHTMIRQLYFPQEQMIGVYAPLLAPLLLPFFFGWGREWKHYREKKKTKKTKQNKDKQE